MLPFNDTGSSMTEPSQHSLSSQSATSGNDVFKDLGTANENQYIRQKEMEM